MLTARIAWFFSERGCMSLLASGLWECVAILFVWGDIGSGVDDIILHRNK
jgi:hypothetical protein